MYAARLRVGFLVGPHKSAKFVAGYKVCCFTFSKFFSSDLHFVPQWNEVVSWGMVGIRSLKILYVKHMRFSFPRASNEGNPSSSNIPVFGPAQNRQSCLMRRIAHFFSNILLRVGVPDNWPVFQCWSYLCILFFYSLITSKTCALKWVFKPTDMYTIWFRRRITLFLTRLKYSI